MSRSTTFELSRISATWSVWTIEAAHHAAYTDKMGMSMVALAKAHGVAEEAAKKSVEAVSRKSAFPRRTRSM